MELTDLDSNERLALVSLVKAVAIADRAVSDEEGDLLADIVDAFGDDSYRKLTEEVDRRFGSEADLKAFLQGVRREEARELIYGTVLDLAMVDVVSGHESPLLAWLASAWNVEATIETRDGDGD
jgi:hypothetical protein